MGRWLELDSLDNQNIVAALLVGSYTAAADIDVYCTLYAQGLAGGGDYVYYIVVTPSGLSAGEALKTTQTLGATTYVLFAQSTPVSLRNGDVMAVYLKGLAGDGAAPDTRVNFYESPSLQPTTAGNKLDVESTGETGINLDNIKQATAPTTLTNITVPTTTSVGTVTGNVNGSVASVSSPVVASSVTGNVAGSVATVTNPVTVGTNNDKTGYALTVTPPTAVQIDTQLSGTHGAGLWGGASGTGAITCIYPVTDVTTGLPLDGVTVKVTTDIAGLNVVAEGITDTSGNVTFYLDAGTYYFWPVKAGYIFVVPDLEVVV